MASKKAVGGGAGAVVAAALVVAVTLLGLNKDAPVVDYNPDVTAPSTRGFGPPCQSGDFAQVSIFGYVRTWNQGSMMPLRAALAQALATSDYRPSYSVGTYNCRPIRGSTTWSHHAWAVAVDLDPAQNCLGCSVSNSEIARDPAFVRSFEHFGFVWGGRWTSRPDAMHFEYDGPALPILGPVKAGDSGALVGRIRDFCRDAGLPHMSKGPYRDRDLLCVVAFQKANGLLRFETPGTVRDATWVLMMLEGRG